MENAARRSRVHRITRSASSSPVTGMDGLNAGTADEDVDPALLSDRIGGAASIAGLLITTEAMVAERPKKETAAAPMPGGMGGMDY